MDWQALTLSVKLSLVTLIFLLPIGIFFGRWLAYRQFFGKSLLQTILALPLVLPPTVLGYYLLVAQSLNQGFGRWLANTFGTTLVFNFQGLVLASIIFNLPFAIQPMLRAFVAIPREIREAAACCGMPPRQVLWKIELPLAWPPHQEGKAVTRAEAEAENLTAISTTTVDHPFHIHVNPFWLSRVDVPIADGSLVNILTEPRWQDVTWLPRGRGRAIFRSRFTDYVGEYVNHCHILLHEDNGMMQLVEVVASVADSNYVARFKVTQDNMSAAQVTAIYPRVSLAEAFSQSGSFVDANTGTGQVFPGFDIPE